MTSWTTQHAPQADRHPQPAPLALRAGIVDVWRARLDRRTAALEAWLSTDERERATRFRFDRDRDRWVAAHAVLRGVLARYLAESPQAVMFAVGEHDKPELAAHHGADRPRFNLAHSGDLALIAVTRGEEVGIDVETVQDRPDLLEVARRVLAREVVAALERVSPSERPASFFRAWVRHEAQVKCRGTGITDTDADTDTDESVVVVDIDAGPGYCAALAAATRPEQVRCWDWAT